MCHIRLLLVLFRKLDGEIDRMLSKAKPLRIITFFKFENSIEIKLGSKLYIYIFFSKY